MQELKPGPEAAKQDEIRQFQGLWMEKVNEMLVK